MPLAGLIADGSGNFYGTTVQGGAGTGMNGRHCGNGCGTVFKVMPDGNEILLYSFKNGRDGSYPNSDLLLDQQAAVYGTANFGGDRRCALQGCGVVFKVDADGTEHVLHAFAGGADGAFPDSGLIRDANGNLFGTTTTGGGSACGGGGCGTVFEVTPQGKESITHAFTGSGDSASPAGDLAIDSQGNIYGTTIGINDDGIVFRLSPSQQFSIVHSFTGADGANPYGGVIDDGSTLYGTTARGGSYDHGTVFSISSDGTESTLYSFTGGSDGGAPSATVIKDSTGTLFGTTGRGGSTDCGGSGCGIAFELAPDGTETVLHLFVGGRKGEYPQGALLLGSDDGLYGTTEAGGHSSAHCGNGCGTLFRLNK